MLVLPLHAGIFLHLSVHFPFLYIGSFCHEFKSLSFHYYGGGPIGATFTALGVIESAVVLSQLSEMYQAELEQTLLQGGVVTPEKPVSGNVSFSDLPKYPDYKLVFNNGRQDMEFTFLRSDREEIINPWADRTSTQVALNYMNDSDDKFVGS